MKRHLAFVTLVALALGMTTPVMADCDRCSSGCKTCCDDRGLLDALDVFASKLLARRAGPGCDSCPCDHSSKACDSCVQTKCDSGSCSGCDGHWSAPPASTPPASAQPVVPQPLPAVTKNRQPSFPVAKPSRQQSRSVEASRKGKPVSKNTKATNPTQQLQNPPPPPMLPQPQVPRVMPVPDSQVNPFTDDASAAKPLRVRAQTIQYRRPAPSLRPSGSKPPKRLKSYGESYDSQADSGVQMRLKDDIQTQEGVVLAAKTSSRRAQPAATDLSPLAPRPPVVTASGNKPLPLPPRATRKLSSASEPINPLR